LLVLAAFAAPKSADGYNLHPGPEPNGDTELWSDDFNDGEAGDWTMEGTPLWMVDSGYAYEGSYGLSYSWGYDQDARAISPEMTIPAGATEIEFTWAWQGSYYWMEDPYDHCTFTIEFREVGEDWVEVWDETQNDPYPFDSWVWYEQLVELDGSWAGKTVQMSFHAVGDDDADIGVDIPMVTYTPSTDDVPPAVGDVSPADGAVDVPLDSDIVFHATDDDSGIDTATIDFTAEDTTLSGGALTMVSPLAEISGTLDVDDTDPLDVICTFTADADLPMDTITCTVAGSLADNAGNTMGSDYVWSFDTLGSNVEPASWGQIKSL
jgi:hypothetical protein